MESNALQTPAGDASACCEMGCCSDGESVKAAVREQYGKVATGEACCGSLCGCTDNAEGLAIGFGYSAEELATLPEGANLGLSCGNPQAAAAMQPGG